MPRDLESEKDTVDNLVPLSREPENNAPPSSGYRDIISGGVSEHDNEPEQGYYFKPGNASQSKRDELHPYVQTLNVTNVESCVALENAAFPPQEAASKEKFQYRLTVCGELALGMFTSQSSSSAPAPLQKQSSEHSGPSTLIAHICATKTTNSTIHDADMDFPKSWQTNRDAEPEVGHKETGRTIAVHSVAVLPEYQKIGLGSTIVKSYVQRMQNAEIADRIALLAHENMIPFYEKQGFVNHGKSVATYGGGGWFDMVYEFPDEEDEGIGEGLEDEMP